MILRLAANAAVHTAGGVAMGVTAVLAACTVAQVAKKGAERAGLAPGGNSGSMTVPPSSPAASSGMPPTAPPPGTPPA